MQNQGRLCPANLELCVEPSDESSTAANRQGLASAEQVALLTEGSREQHRCNPLILSSFKLISAEATVALWWLSLVSGDTERLQKASTENDHVFPMLSSCVYSYLS